MMPKVKNVAIVLTCCCKGNPTISLLMPICALSSVEKNSIKGMNQRFNKNQLIAREHKNIGGDSNGNPDTGNI